MEPNLFTELSTFFVHVHSLGMPVICGPLHDRTSISEFAVVPQAVLPL
jgi:hypothetical protein